jgi:hypothetical protein
MDTQPIQQQEHTSSIRRRYGLEALLFVVACAVGIYGLGQGLTGLLSTGEVINLGWLAVAGLAFYVLTAQMARVHDSWPHRQTVSRSLGGPHTDTAQEPLTTSESR